MAGEAFGFQKKKKWGGKEDDTYVNWRRQLDLYMFDSSDPLFELGANEGVLTLTVSEAVGERSCMATHPVSNSYL